MPVPPKPILPSEMAPDEKRNKSFKSRLLHVIRLWVYSNVTLTANLLTCCRREQTAAAERDFASEFPKEIAVAAQDSASLGLFNTDASKYVCITHELVVGRISRLNRGLSCQSPLMTILEETC